MFFWVKNSWKCCGFGYFSCWQLWFHEKNCQKNLSEKLVKMLGFCQNWIIGQKFDFSNSVNRFSFIFFVFQQRQPWRFSWVFRSPSWSSHSFPRSPIHKEPDQRWPTPSPFRLTSEDKGLEMSKLDSLARLFPRPLTTFTNWLKLNSQMVTKAPNFIVWSKISWSKEEISPVEMVRTKLPKRNLFLSKKSTLISREYCQFLGVKKSWKCCGFGLFSCWQLWFHEKKFQKKFGWKTREIVGVLSKLIFWTKIWLFE